MASFTKNNRTGNYDVIGEADELSLGPVQVTKKDGSTKTVTIVKLSKPFTGKFGKLKGKQCRIGTVGSNGNGGSRRIRTPDGVLIDEDDACDLCGRNKYTCGHCIGW